MHGAKSGGWLKYVCGCCPCIFQDFNTVRSQFQLILENVLTTYQLFVRIERGIYLMNSTDYAIEWLLISTLNVHQNGRNTITRQCSYRGGQYNARFNIIYRNLMSVADLYNIFVGKLLYVLGAYKNIATYTENASLFNIFYLINLLFKTRVY